MAKPHLTDQQQEVDAFSRGMVAGRSSCLLTLLVGGFLTVGGGIAGGMLSLWYYGDNIAEMRKHDPLGTKWALWGALAGLFVGNWIVQLAMSARIRSMHRRSDKDT